MIDSHSSEDSLLRSLGIDRKASILQPASGKLLNQAAVKLVIKRDDRLHPVISGNKWRKLAGLLPSLAGSGLPLWTMGGPWSNLLHSLGYIGAKLSWPQRFFVRFHVGQPPTATLRDLQQWQRPIHPINRKCYAELRDIPTATYVFAELVRNLSLPARQYLQDELLELSEQKIYWLAEGGLSESATTGFVALAKELDDAFDWVVCASATGTSVAGLARAFAALGHRTKVLGIAVLNNLGAQRENVCRLLAGDFHNWEILDGFTSGGFAKSNPLLLRWIHEFNAGVGEFVCAQGPACRVEPVYSGKSFFATAKLIRGGYFRPGERICLLHCGGMQGARGSLGAD